MATILHRYGSTNLHSWRCVFKGDVNVRRAQSRPSESIGRICFGHSVQGYDGPGSTWVKLAGTDGYFMTSNEEQGQLMEYEGIESHPSAGGTLNAHHTYSEYKAAAPNQGAFNSCGIYATLGELSFQILSSQHAAEHGPHWCAEPFRWTPEVGDFDEMHDNPYFSVQDAAESVVDWGMTNDDGDLIKTHGTSLPRLVDQMNQHLRNKSIRGKGGYFHIGQIQVVDGTSWWPRCHRSLDYYGKPKDEDEYNKLPYMDNGVVLTVPQDYGFGHFMRTKMYTQGSGNQHGFEVQNSWGDPRKFTVPNPDVPVFHTVGWVYCLRFINVQFKPDGADEWIQVHIEKTLAPFPDTVQYIRTKGEMARQHQ